MELFGNPRSYSNVEYSYLWDVNEYSEKIDYFRKEQSKEEEMKFLVIPLIAAALIFLSAKLSAKTSPVIDVQERIIYHANKNGLEAALVKAIAKKESNFDPGARNFERSPEDFDDSIGLMQITAALAQDYGLVADYRSVTELEIQQMFEINNNLTVACKFLKRLSKYSFAQMIQSYNVGEWGYKIGKRNPVYLEKVRGYYEQYS